MRSLWLAWLPLLFLPNMGLERQTPFGVLDLADVLIGPLLVLEYLAIRGREHRRAHINRIALLLAGFVGWALLSTLLIGERYGYATDASTLLGVTKLAKLTLYGVAGLLAAQALADDRQRRLFSWSLLAAGIMVGVSLSLLQDVSDELRRGEVMEGYKSKNSVSVMTAILLCYLGGLWITGRGSWLWRVAAGPGLIAMLLGFFLSTGRGGWVGAAVGALYLLCRRGLTPRILTGLMGVSLLISIAYATLPNFGSEVDKTLWPDQSYLQQYKSGLAGVDDGDRLTTWSHELDRFPDALILGRGFYHRGGASGLWTTGSHNFWLQMFLETGAVGGLLVLWAMLQMWLHAGSAVARAAGLVLPVRSALLAAFVGGMTETHFYGGVVLLVLLLVYAPVGAFATETEATESDPAPC